MVQILGFGSAFKVSQTGIFVLVLLSAYCAVQVLYRMLKKGKIQAIEWAYLVILASPFVTAVMAAFTTVESTPRYYFMLVYAMAFSVVLFREKFRFLFKYVGIAVLILTAANIYQIYLPVCKSEEPPDTEAYEVVCYLEENNISIAYADFENANAMTALSNGRVRVAAVASMARMDICKWLSSTEWYPPMLPYHSATAYIVTRAERDEFEQFMAGKEENIKKENEIGKFSIYVSDRNYANEDYYEKYYF